MKRRTYLKSLLTWTGALAISGQGRLKAATGGKIQLHVDLSVDPAKEAEMLHNFKTIFLPAAVKQPGYIDVQLLSLQSAIQGSAPAGLNYRFVLTYESEALRQKWVASETHKKVWPTIEKTLSSTSYTVLLFDIA